MTELSHSGVVQALALGTGVVLLAAIFVTPEALWLILPSIISFVIGVTVAWNRARDAVGMVASEQMSDPTFGHDDPGDVLVIENDGSASETLSLNRAESQYTAWRVDPPLTFESTYEYRIEDTRVFQRLINEWQDEEGKTWHSVKDNVVLESEIRRHWTLHSQTSGLWKDDVEGAQKQAEWRIGSNREEIEWHELSRPLVRYFILSRHPESLPGLEYRRFFRQELERIEAGINALVKKGEEMGAVLEETSHGASLRLSQGSESTNDEHDDHCACDRCKAEAALIQLQTSPDSLIWFNISEAEFVEGKKVAVFLRGLLGETG